MTPSPAGPKRLPPPGLDPALPDLAAVLDPAGVARRFADRWPGPGAAPAIGGCVLEHVSWSPGAECRTTWRLTLTAAAGGPATTIGVVTATPAGVCHRLLTTDPELPGLAAATDTRVMRDWLSDRAGHRIEACSITPMSYRPGSRCVLRYGLSGGGRAAVVYGKLLTPDDFAALASTVGSLGDLLTPPLVGVDPGWRLLVQRDAGERSLGSAAAGPTTATVLAEVRSGGRLLARLHRRAGPPGSRRSLADDLEGLRGHLPEVRRVSAPVAERMTTGIERLAGLAGVASPPAPGHGAFRLDQVHLGARGPVLIDLDSFCWAEPARDAGNLLAYLRWREIRRPREGASVAAIRAAFLAGYAERAPAPLDAGRLRVLEAAAALKIAGRRCRRLAVEEWERLGELVSAALDLLDAVPGRAA